MAAPISGAHLRVARPTDNLTALRTFYIDGLGFQVLYEFKDHNGFDGMMLGFETLGYNLELITAHGHTAGGAPTEDNLLIFYLPDEEVWKAAVERMESVGYAAVKAFNPYWDNAGKTFEDPDGYRVVLQRARWVNTPLGQSNN